MKKNILKLPDSERRTKIIRLAEWAVKALTVKFLDKVDMLSQFQKDSIECVELMLKDPLCEIYWAPEDARFMKNDNSAIKLYSERITITKKVGDKTGHFEERIPEHIYNKLITQIDEEMTRRIVKIEKSILSEISDLLIDVKDDLKSRIPSEEEIK